MRRLLRHLYMKATSASLPWAGSRPYVRVLYGVWSKIYDWTVAWDPAYRRNARRMILAAVNQGDRVLDIGIGTGLLVEYGGPMASEYVGIDYSGAMLAQAARKISRRGLDNVVLRWGDARSLPFSPGVFDTVVSSFTLAHFSRTEKKTVLSEAHRVLKDGGSVGLFQAQGEAAPLFCTRAELTALLDGCGFGDIRIEDVDDVYRIALARKK